MQVFFRYFNHEIYIIFRNFDICLQYCYLHGQSSYLLRLFARITMIERSLGFQYEKESNYTKHKEL